MASLLRQLRREAAKPKKTLIGVYGAFNRFNLLVDGDILLVFTDEADLTSFLSSEKKVSQLLMPKLIQPMYFEDLLAGFRAGGKYSLRREVAEKFLVAWTKNYRDSAPFTSVDLDKLDKIEDFLSLSAR